MLEFSLYVNVLLFAIGLMLIFVLVSEQQRHPILVRAILLAYFLVVLQYNIDRLRMAGDKFLLLSAAIALIVWVRKPIPAAE
jgi:hypothetical protein